MHCDDSAAALPDSLLSFVFHKVVTNDFSSLACLLRINVLYHEGTDALTFSTVVTYFITSVAACCCRSCQGGGGGANASVLLCLGYVKHYIMKHELQVHANEPSE